MSAQSKKSAKSKDVVAKIKSDSEKSARRNLLEELFNDFHSSRHQVYLMNFFRGLFFGFGSVLGATILVALVVWLLGQFGDIFPPLADFVNNLIETMQQRR
ncbi:hypothetical protein B7Y94_02050 [Candidatus Saccharibacteria bacterium 32-49-12]|nr:MAG: hypothetical protein B7Y94_02050 [Candidatus Saccharibacteria bacterium 32-49-12]